MTTQIEMQIAADLNKCDTALFFAKGAQRRRILKHKKACFAEIKAMNDRDFPVAMTDDELLEALGA